MKYIKRSILLLTILLLIPNMVSAYELHEPVIIRYSPEGNSATNPLIIEGYEITNPGGPCIFIENTEHVIVRNNYLHDCGTDISAELIANNPRDDDCVGGMTDFMETGALNLFRNRFVEVYGNKIINNDYGIRVEGHEKQMEKVHIFDNIVHKSHRSHFIWVKDADNVKIYKNDVRHNGLSEMFDNEVLAKMLAGENIDCCDGRSQGIAISKCNNVKIYDNFVLNSSSDGIGIVGEPKKPSTNVEIYGNEIIESGEQGIWLAGAHDIKIYRNKVYQSKHRADEQGGNSGIMIETNTINAEIYENEVYYNDMFGISLTAGSDISIYNNNIHHNGDGGISIFHLDYIGEEKIDNIIISDNDIHHNRNCAIFIDNNYFTNIVVKKNNFTNNGGNPIHHEFYLDNDFSLHIEDWIIDSENVFSVSPNEMFDELTISENTGYPVKKGKKDKGTLTNSNDSILDELKESWEAVLLAFIIPIFFLIGTYIHKKRKKNN